MHYWMTCQQFYQFNKLLNSKKVQYHSEVVVICNTCDTEDWSNDAENSALCQKNN